jgi:hypothetical protein
MSAKVKAKGEYDLIEDQHRHRFIVLNGRRWYAIIGGQKSPILVRTDSDHQKKRELQHGEFLYVDFKNDPEFRDMPHLFLQKNGRYREFLLPNGFPTRQDPQKRLVITRHMVPKEKLQKYLQ